MAYSLDTITWGYRHWAQDPNPIITVNDTTIVNPATFKIDYKNGVMYSSTAMTLSDKYQADYTFAYLTTEDLYTFLRTTLGDLNAQPPHTMISFDSAPNEWEDAIFLGAYIKALRKLLLDLGTFQWRRVFEDVEGLRAQVNSLLASATADYDKAAKHIKRRALLVPGVVHGLDVARMPATVDQNNWRDYTLVAL